MGLPLIPLRSQRVRDKKQTLGEKFFQNQRYEVLETLPLHWQQVFEIWKENVVILAILAVGAALLFYFGIIGKK